MLRAGALPRGSTAAPHNAARRTFVEVDGVVQPSAAPRFDRTPASVGDPPAVAGEHSIDVLLEAGFTHAEVDALIDAGVVGHAQPVGAKGDDGADGCDGRHSSRGQRRDRGVLDGGEGGSAARRAVRGVRRGVVPSERDVPLVSCPHDGSHRDHEQRTRLQLHRQPSALASRPRGAVRDRARRVPRPSRRACRRPAARVRARRRVDRHGGRGRLRARTRRLRDPELRRRRGVDE